MAAVNSTVFLHVPSDGVVNSNIGFAITFTVLASALCGAVLLPVVLLKSLRSQPYQLLIGNYVSCSLSTVIGNGIYRIVKIRQYRANGFEEAASKTECGLFYFCTFPLVSSNFCLAVVGWEKFISLYFRKTTDWATMIVFIGLPWALGLFEYSAYLADDSERYENFPYLGSCDDISNERDARRIIHFFLDIVLPVVVTSATLSLAGSIVYNRYREIKIQSNNNRENDRTTLNEKKMVKKAFTELSIPVVFLCLRICFMTIITSLYREYGSDGNTRDKDDNLLTASYIFLLFEPCIIPVVFFILNSDLRRELQIYLPSYISAVVFPSADGQESVIIEEVGSQDITSSSGESAANIGGEDYVKEIIAVKEYNTETNM